MKKYLVCNYGCDDTTRFEIKLDNKELETILKFIKLNNDNSKYHCQPTIDIYNNYFYDEDKEATEYKVINGKEYKAKSLLGDKENEN